MSHDILIAMKVGEGCMRQHAVMTATALYEDGSLTLVQAAEYAGVSAGKMRESLRARGIEVRDPELEVLDERRVVAD